MYRRIGQTLSPKEQSGITRIDVPDTQDRGPNLGKAEEPKTWKGPWVSITNTDMIAQQIKHINIQQFHQAFSTPFGSGPLAEFIGQNGDTPGA
jgi:hypothetical protein